MTYKASAILVSKHRIVSGNLYSRHRETLFSATRPILPGEVGLNLHLSTKQLTLLVLSQDYTYIFTWLIEPRTDTM